MIRPVVEEEPDINVEDVFYSQRHKNKFNPVLKWK